MVATVSDARDARRARHALSSPRAFLTLSFAARRHHRVPHESRLSGANRARMNERPGGVGHLLGSVDERFGGFDLIVSRPRLLRAAQVPATRRCRVVGSLCGVLKCGQLFGDEDQPCGLVAVEQDSVAALADDR
jgi:hypothetical protein